MRSDVITAFNSIQPYKGGKDDKLWVLNELSKRDKHRLLITVGSAFQSLNLGAYMSTQMSNNQFGIPIPKLNAYFRPADNLFPLKAADELFIDAVDAQPSKELDFRFNIMLNEPEVIEGAPLIDTLNGFSDIVSKTILQFGQCLT